MMKCQRAGIFSWILLAGLVLHPASLFGLSGNPVVWMFSDSYTTGQIASLQQNIVSMNGDQPENEQISIILKPVEMLMSSIMRIESSDSPTLVLVDPGAAGIKADRNSRTGHTVIGAVRDALRGAGIPMIMMTGLPQQGTYINACDDVFTQSDAVQRNRAEALATRNLARRFGITLIDVQKWLHNAVIADRGPRVLVGGKDYLLSDFVDRQHMITALGLQVLAEFIGPAAEKAYAGELAASAATLPEAKSTSFSIPTIDISCRKEIQAVVDREQGQYLGHVTTAMLEDSMTVYAVYPKGHGRGAVVMKRSLDGGKSWSERLPVPENWSASKEVPTLYTVFDAENRKRHIMFSGLYPIKMAVSEDNCQTWSPLKPIGDFGGIVAMGDIAEHAPGEYFAYFHDDGRFIDNSGNRKNVFYMFSTRSNDGGLTWSQPDTILHVPHAHICEPGIVRSPDGKQLAMLLRENSRRYNSFLSFSDDNGATWSTPTQMPASLTGDRHTAKYASDGRIVITFRDRTPDSGSPTEGDWVAWVGTYFDLLTGGEGQYRIRLGDNHSNWDTAYPGLERLRDGTFLATTYGSWTRGEQPYILSVRFNLAVLDAMLVNK